MRGIANCGSLTALAICLLSAQILAGHLYFSDRGANQIFRSDFHGKNRVELFNADDFPASLPGPKRFRGLVADPQRGFVFFTDSTENMVLRGTIATREIVALVEANQSFPADITMDHANGKIYWCNRTKNLIQRADLDGSNLEDLVQAPLPYFLQLDLVAGKIYFGDFSAGNIFRADLADGKNVETLVSGITGQVRGVHFDPAAAMLYWANRNDGKIQRRPLQGSAADIEDLYTGLDTPHGLMLDLPSCKVYWADTGTNGTGGQSVQRGDMDGSGAVETLFQGSQPWDVYVQPEIDSYDDWRTRQFRIDDPAEVASPAADPDRDGLVNLLELALGRKPTKADGQSALLPQIVEVNHESFPALVFDRPAGRSFLDYIVEVSSDLETWISGSAITAAPVISQSREGFETVTIRTRDPLSTTNPTFLRLRVE